MVEKRTLSVWRHGAIGIGGAMAIMIGGVAAGRLILGPAVPGAAPPPQAILWMTVVAALSVSWAVFFVRRMFAHLDEFQQQGSRVAWYWGASFGIAASAPLYMFIALGGLHWLWPAQFHLGRDLLRAFQIGYMLPIVCQVLGALAVGIWWRASRR